MIVEKRKNLPNRKSQKKPWRTIGIDVCRLQLLWLNEPCYRISNGQEVFRQKEIIGFSQWRRYRWVSFFFVKSQVAGLTNEMSHWTFLRFLLRNGQKVTAGLGFKYFRRIINWQFQDESFFESWSSFNAPFCSNM